MMERTQIYLSNTHKVRLQKLAEAEGKTMAEVVREAVELYLAVRQEEIMQSLTRTEGLWKDRKDIGDSGNYVDDMRQSSNNRFEEQ